MDDHDDRRRHGQRFPDSDSFFGRIHEGFTTYSEKNVWPITNFLWTSRCRRQPRFCRSGKPNRIRVRDESNGAIAFAECEIITARRGDLPVAAPCVSRAPYAMLGSAHRALESEARTWSSNFGLPCSGAAGKKEDVLSFYPAPLPEKSRNRRNNLSSNCS